MCGRYALYNIRKVNSKFKVSIESNFNISPGSKVLIINEKLEPLKISWGLKPYWGKKGNLIINARSETLNEKRVFKELKRCFFVADGFYEWRRGTGEKFPYYHYQENYLIYFAGLYNHHGCCIVTKEASKKLSFIHKRQPLVLSELGTSLWLRKAQDFDENLAITYYQVSKDVNKAWNNSSDLIKSISGKKGF